MLARVLGLDRPALDLLSRSGVEVPDPFTELPLPGGRIEVAGEVHAVKGQPDGLEVPPVEIESDLGPRQEDVGDGGRELRLRDLPDLVVRVVEVAGLALAKLADEPPVEGDRLDVVRLLPPLPVGGDGDPPPLGEPLGVVVERVVIPRVLLAELKRRLELAFDPLPLRPGAAVLAKPHGQQIVRAGLILGPAGDGAGVLQDIERDVVVAVPPLVPAPLGRGHPPHHVQVAAPGELEVVGARPEVESVLVMLPPLAPVLRAAAGPPEVAERFVGLGPDAVAVLGPLEFADDRLQLATSLFVDRVVVGARSGAGPPAGVRDPEGDPAGLLGGELQPRLAGKLGRLGVERVRSGKGALGVGGLGEVLDPGVLGRSRLRPAQGGRPDQRRKTEGPDGEA